MADLTSKSAVECFAGLRNKEFSATELTQAHVDRVAHLEPRLNSFVTPTPELALATAAIVDAKIAAGEPLPPLAGIPIGIKDIFCTAGIRSTGSSRILENYIPPHNATVVQKIRDQFGVIIGKNNCDEFAMGSSNESSAYGTVANPWDISCVPGGSSGGSAAAVAAGECVYSIGTDTGGSIRQPAGFCGVVGLKVTYGRVSRSGVMSMTSSLDTIGPITRTVADAALVLQQIAGTDPMDSTTPPEPVPDYSATLDKPVKGMRLGVPAEYFIDGLNAEVRAAIDAAIDIYKQLGVEIVPVHLPNTTHAVAVYYIICPSEVSSNMARYDGIRYGHRAAGQAGLIDQYKHNRAEGFGVEVQRRIMVGTYTLSAGYYDAYYRKAQQVRTLVKQDFEKVFTQVDALITPTSPTTAFKIGANTDDPIQMYLADIFTIPANLAGVPALAVPAGFDSNGLPIGLQLIGPRFGEAALLQLGHQYQQATNWHQRRPDLG